MSLVKNDRILTVAVVDRVRMGCIRSTPGSPDFVPVAGCRPDTDRVAGQSSERCSPPGDGIGDRVIVSFPYLLLFLLLNMTE